MKKNIITILALITIICITIISCGDSGSLSSMSIEKLNERGWNAFKKNNLSSAERHFAELTKRADDRAILDGHLGLGWTNLKRHRYENAKISFDRFFEHNTTSQLYPASAIEFIDARAGQIIAMHVNREHDWVSRNSTAYHAQPAQNWEFRFDSRINHLDIRLYRAMSLWMLGNFTGCLEIVRFRDFDPLFTTEINSIEGRLRLKNKLTELIDLRRNQNP